MNEINDLLEQLKQTLENVDSARVQSETTVKSYVDLKKEADKYVKKLGSIASCINEVLVSIQNYENKIKENFTSTVQTYAKDREETSIQFHNKIDSILSDFKASLNETTKVVKDQQSVLESTSNDIIKHFTESYDKITQKVVDETDQAYSDIRVGISQQMENLKDHVKKLETLKDVFIESSSDIKNVFDENKKHQKNFEQKQDTTITLANALKTGSDTICNSMQDIQSKIISESQTIRIENNEQNKKIDQILTSIKDTSVKTSETLEKTNKENKVLKTLVIINLIISFLSVLLHFLV